MRYVFLSLSWSSLQSPPKRMFLKLASFSRPWLPFSDQLIARNQLFRVSSTFFSVFLCVSTGSRACVRSSAQCNCFRHVFVAVSVFWWTQSNMYTLREHLKTVQGLRGFNIKFLRTLSNSTLPPRRSTSQKSSAFPGSPKSPGTLQNPELWA